MCADNKCGGYSKNWGCPPGCGSVEENRKRVTAYSQGLVFTYAARMEDPFDYETIEEGAKKIEALGNDIRASIRQMPDVCDVWLLTAGPCKQCPRCQYPEPCVRPQDATSSPEAQGMWVSEICTQAGVAYNNGKNTVTYLGVIFFREK
jgi:predicted metal-binding protein